MLLPVNQAVSSCHTKVSPLSFAFSPQRFCLCSWAFCTERSAATHWMALLFGDSNRRPSIPTIIRFPRCLLYFTHAICQVRSYISCTHIDYVLVLTNLCMPHIAVRQELVQLPSLLSHDFFPIPHVVHIGSSKQPFLNHPQNFYSWFRFTNHVYSF